MDGALGSIVWKGLLVSMVFFDSSQEYLLKNFNLLISTTNGTGSQSANNVILKSLFRCDYHISGKNLFPSNISGLPTSYALRVCHSQSNAYQNGFDLLIAMNPQTIESDL